MIMADTQTQTTGSTSGGSTILSSLLLRAGRRASQLPPSHSPSSSNPPSASHSRTPSHSGGGAEQLLLGFGGIGPPPPLPNPRRESQHPNQQQRDPHPISNHAGAATRPSTSPSTASNNAPAAVAAGVKRQASASNLGTGGGGGLFRQPRQRNQSSSPGGDRNHLNQASSAPPNTSAFLPSSHVPAQSQSQSSSSSGGGGLAGLSNMLRRRRSAGNISSQTNTSSSAAAAAAAAAAAGNHHHHGAPPLPTSHSLSSRPQSSHPLMHSPSSNGGVGSSSGMTAGPGAPPNPSSSLRIRLVPHLDGRRTLKFDAITRDVKESDSPLRIGRFTDRSGLGLTAVNALGSNKLAFKSKVVSRSHAEIWLSSGKFYIKDTKSSSGTFLNHSRLSAAGVESKPFGLKDGDVVQLGVDYQGGTEDIYKSVKIRLEIGREWQQGANAFNTAAMKNLKSLAISSSTSAVPPSAVNGAAGAQKNLQGKSKWSDCCICLFAVGIRQALFIAPCSHTFHYKCIRPLLESHHPAFSCPLCRTFADLEEDVEVELEEDMLIPDDEESAGEEGEGDGDGDGSGTPNVPETSGGGGGDTVGAEGVLSEDEDEEDPRGRPTNSNNPFNPSVITTTASTMTMTAAGTRASSMPPASGFRMGGIDDVMQSTLGGPTGMMGMEHVSEMGEVEVEVTSGDETPDGSGEGAMGEEERRKRRR